MRSKNGHAILFRSGLVGWRPSKQKCLAASSIKSEYGALSECIQKTWYYRRVLKEIEKATVLAIAYENNQACISWATEEIKEEQAHRRTSPGVSGGCC